MKQTLLFFILLATATGFSKNTFPKKTSNPAIGVLMSGNYVNTTMIMYYVTIKNIGDETLYNITGSNLTGIPGGTQSFAPIASLQPGEEITGLTVIRYDANPCYDEFSIYVEATTLGGLTVHDYSADPNRFDSNNLPGSYYNDIPTQSYNFIPVPDALQDGIYEDLNGNSIVDVGDVVNYTYTLSGAFQFFSCEIYDNNAVVQNPVFDYNGVSYSTTGQHFLTQADVDLGYVYNSSFLLIPDSCVGGVGFSDASYCWGCPNPGGANVTTKLTSLLPNTISGQVKFNANSDCATAFNFPNRRITSTAGSYEYTTFTNASGNYWLLIPNSGTYVTSATSSLNSNFSSTPASVAIASSGSGTNYMNTDFCIASSNNYSDLRVNLFNTNQAIPGFNVNYHIYYENTGSTNLNGTITLTLPAGIFANVSPSPLPDNVTGTTLTWTYSNLLPYERRGITLGALLNIPPAANVGDILTLTLEGTPLTGDNNPTDNYFTLNQKVFSSFDPNDKTVLEGATITAEQAAGYLTYITRFQNTGTANATTVVVKETLDADLDWSTFEPIDASHAYNIQLHNGNDLTYTFSNIGLAYALADEPASHGWLAYRIKPKSNFAIGDIASSSSGIYFDFNPPVLTNTVNTQLAPLATADFAKNSFVVYPNPAHNFVNIENKNNIAASVQISDSNGKLLQSLSIENSKTIDISALQPGFYFMTIRTAHAKTTYKLIRN